MPYRVFLVVYLVVAIPAAVFVAFPAILLIVLLFTFGLAFPLALLPAVAVYRTAANPAGKCFSTRSWHKPSGRNS